jgi:DNA-binding winged helix-turn-helix (wHTH) protein
MVPNEPNYRFDDFLLDVSNRQLWQGDTRIDLNGRYFDALVLLVREHGQLVGKDRLFADVWQGVLVSDSALTQCIKAIRRQLGDNAVNPRYIQTVPRYGYRFVGRVERLDPQAALASAPSAVPNSLPLSARSIATPESERAPSALRRAIFQSIGGTLGGGLAGVLGGLLYGFGLAYASGGTEVGAASMLLVFIGITGVIGIAGGLGVSCGLAAAGLFTRHRPVWRVVGAALGGMVVGGLAKLLGVDAFNLLFGRAPTGMTGGVEGLALGAALALGAQLAGGVDAAARWRPVLGAGLGGAVAGGLIPLAGGNLMGGSLELLAQSFAASRLQLDALGGLFGEPSFGHTAQAIFGGIEGLLFGSCVAGGVVLARRVGRWG